MACPRPRAKFAVYSVGWAEVLSNLEVLAETLLFDLSKVGHDHDAGGAPRWLNFGGDGSILDKELEANKVLSDVVKVIISIMSRYLLEVKDAEKRGTEEDIEDFSLSVVCNYGKHRSRYVVSRVHAWLVDNCPDLEDLVSFHHLSEDNRRREVMYYKDCLAQGYKPYAAMKFAKTLGLRDDPYDTRIQKPEAPPAIPLCSRHEE